MPITKREHVLADGRQLIYFDDADTTLSPDRKPDARILDARPPTATMRQDVLTGEWISIAAARQNRAFLPPAEADPLAPQTPANPSEVPSVYDVAVFENRSPSFGPALGVPGEAADLTSVGLRREHPSVGRCEVVCFSPQSEGSFGSLTPSRARTVIEAWADRTAVLSALPGVEQVFPFENRGEEIGVTLAHPHGQIYAYPFVTPRTRRVLASAQAHRERTGRSLYEDLLAAELADGSRVVVSSEHWVAFVPAAARWPFEVHLHPRRRTPDLPSLTDAERADLGPVYLEVLRRLDGVFGLPMPYVAAWHQAPVHTGREDAALHLQLFSTRRAPGKLKYLAGSESAMDVFINDVAPERAAQLLRDAEV